MGNNEKAYIKSMAKDRKKQLRGILFQHLDGITLCSTIATLFNNGITQFILENKTFTIQDILSKYECNAGYMNVALRLLASQGWLKRNIIQDGEDIEFHLTEKGVKGMAHAHYYDRFYTFIPFLIDIDKYFPILTGKKIYPHIYESEFKWFISGHTNVKELQEKGNTIWNEWANKAGDLGPVYGHQLRNFNSQGYDQLESVLNSLQNDPDSRRHIINLWNPNQLADMALPPCYLYFQFFVDGNNLNMFALQRSADLFLGVPYDMALFAQLLLYVAEKTNLKAKNLDVKFIDAHIYNNHFEAVKTYLNEPYTRPVEYTYENEILTLKNYKAGKVIKAPVAI